MFYFLQELGSCSCSDDGLVPCFMCQKRFSLETIDAHANTHFGDAEPPPPPPPAPKPTKKPPAQPAFNPTPLPKITYHMMSESKLRKKLKDMGIPSHGPKGLLEARHTEW